MFLLVKLKKKQFYFPFILRDRATMILFCSGKKALQFKYLI
jgi:hypothetical protein